MSAKVPAEMYSGVADTAAALVISQYSTSFSLACRLLQQPVRRQVQNIYALVRIADEIVDGSASGSGATPEQIRACLDRFEQETEEALRTGYSSNLIIHAFATTARKVGITSALTAPFFASMRSDLTPTTHTPASLQEYIYGSAEVVGLMCVRAFAAGYDFSDRDLSALDAGARRLGAAFQKVNFLRDLDQDMHALDRRYLPVSNVEDLSDSAKEHLLRDIHADLAAARPAIARLPRSSRSAVAAAHALFTELANHIGRTPAHELAEERIRVPNPTKLRLAAFAVLSQQTAELRRPWKRLM